jgi:hypothetical protein
MPCVWPNASAHHDGIHTSELKEVFDRLDGDAAYLIVGFLREAQSKIVFCPASMSRHHIGVETASKPEGGKIAPLREALNDRGQHARWHVLGNVPQKRTLCHMQARRGSEIRSAGQNVQPVLIQYRDFGLLSLTEY